MPNYKNGMIYKLVNDENDDIYIGSTSQTLPKRLGNHKAKYKCYLNNSNSYFITSFNIIKYQSCKIILIEEFPCKSKIELEKRERHYIDTLKCVNKIIPTRSKNEYRKIHREKMLQEKKMFYIKNKERYSQKAKETYMINKKQIRQNQHDYYKYKSSWGGDKRTQNNLLLIDVNLFTI